MTRDKLLLSIKLKQDKIKELQDELITLRREFDKVKYDRIILFNDGVWVDLENLRDDVVLENGQLFRKLGDDMWLNADMHIERVFSDLEELKFYFYNRERGKLNDNNYKY